SATSSRATISTSRSIFRSRSAPPSCARLEGSVPCCSDRGAGQRSGRLLPARAGLTSQGASCRRPVDQERIGIFLNMQVHHYPVAMAGSGLSNYVRDHLVRFISGDGDRRRINRYAALVLPSALLVDNLVTSIFSGGIEMLSR